jgi:hypothetical protein
VLCPSYGRMLLRRSTAVQATFSHLPDIHEQEEGK